jgi:hypothetical protein
MKDVKIHPDNVLSATVGDLFEVLFHSGHQVMVLDRPGDDEVPPCAVIVCMGDVTANLLRIVGLASAMPILKETMEGCGDCCTCTYNASPTGFEPCRSCLRSEESPGWSPILQ